MTAHARILIRLDAQTLELLDGDRIVASYPVSTGCNGPGEERDSG